MPFYRSKNRRNRRFGSKTSRRPTYRRRYRTKKRYNKFRRTRIKIPGVVFPDYTLVKMNVRDTLDIGFGTIPATPGEYSFINAVINPMDLTNPFFTYSPDDPVGLRTWAQFYESFIVHQATLKVTPISFTIQNQADTSVTIPSDNPSLPYQITLVPVTLGTLSSAFIAFDEQPYAKRKMFNAVNSGTTYNNVIPPAVLGLQANNQNNITTPVIVSAGANYAMFNAQSGDNVRSYIMNTMMTKKMLGYKDLSDVEEVRGSTILPPGSGPATQWYWMIEVKSLIPWDGVNDVAHYTLGQCNVRAEMFFKTQFLDRLPIADGTL